MVGRTGQWINMNTFHACMASGIKHGQQARLQFLEQLQCAAHTCTKKDELGHASATEKVLGLSRLIIFAGSYKQLAISFLVFSVRLNLVHLLVAS